jgi:hypothetical protein
MITEGVDNRFIESSSPHSLGLQNDVTISTPGFDSNPLMVNQKRFWGAGLQGPGCCKGLGGLTFDGSGLFGTGLFSGDVSSWGVSEVLASMVGMYAFYSMFYQAKQTKYRIEGARRRQRVSKAKRLRERAKRLEEKTVGLF